MLVASTSGEPVDSKTLADVIQQQEMLIKEEEKEKVAEKKKKEQKVYAYCKGYYHNQEKFSPFVMRQKL